MARFNTSDEVWKAYQAAEDKYQQGDFNSAQQLFRQTAKWRESHLGRNHTDTLWSKYNVGRSLYKLGRYEEAEGYFQDTAQGRELTLGENDPNTLWSKYHLGETQYHLGKYGKASESFSQTARGRKTALGPDDPDTLWSTYQLAKSLEHLGKVAEAEQNYSETVRRREAVFGPRDINTLWSKYAFARLLLHMGKYSEAERVFRQTAEGREAVLGPEHSDTLWSKYYLAEALYSQGKVEEATRFSTAAYPLNRVPSNQKAPVPAGKSDKQDVFDFPTLMSTQSISTSDTEADSFFSFHMGRTNYFFQGLRMAAADNVEPVKIAILDTGIDMDSEGLREYCEANETPEIAYRDFLEPQATARSDNDTGHGTYCAKLLLKVAPKAQLYIARVFATSQADSVTIQRIRDAINYAVDEWAVDIISMSWSFTEFQMDIYDAIAHARAKKVLLFAAASNNRHNEPKPIGFPARLHDVICVNSCNSQGIRSPFSPLGDPHRTSFSVLGEVVSAELPVPTNNSHIDNRRSGTSTSTPILAGIAALILEFTKLRSVRFAERLLLVEGMRAVLHDCMAGDNPPAPPVYCYIRPWILFGYNELDPHDVAHNISEALRRSL